MNEDPLQRHLKTVRIPARIVDGEIRRRDGAALPTITEGSELLLTVAEAYMPDSQSWRMLVEEDRVTILPDNTTVMIGLQLRSRGRDNDALSSEEKHKLQRWLHQAPPRGSLTAHEMHPPPADGDFDLFVPVLLTDSLGLHLRGAKRAKLARCRCWVDALGHAGISPECISLNQAYSRLSEQFELWRISHTGNVFKMIFFEREGQWLPLDVLRDEHEALDTARRADKESKQCATKSTARKAGPRKTDSRLIEQITARLSESPSPLDAEVDVEQAARVNQRYAVAPKQCGKCDAPFAAEKYMIDGRLDVASEAWGNVCGACFARDGGRLGRGIGQLYLRLPGDRWLLVAGFQNFR